MRFSTIEIPIPNIQQAAQQRNILFRWCSLEMVIHCISTTQELPEIIESNIKTDRKTNRRPNTISPTDPRFKSKHILLVNSEFGNFLFIRGKCHEMFSDIRFILG